MLNESLSALVLLAAFVLSSCSSDQSTELKQLYQNNETKFITLPGQITVKHDNGCDYITADELIVDWLEHDKLYVCVSGDDITAIVVSESRNPMLTYIADPDGSRYGVGQEYVVGRLWFECEYRFNENWYLCNFSAN